MSGTRLLVMIPAFNEEACVGAVVRGVRRVVPEADVVVVDDGSTDRTSDVARQAGALALTLPCNLGVGGAAQAGFLFAYEQGYDYLVRCDADGQHPPEEIPKLLAGMRDAENIDLIIGSRFLSEVSYRSTWVRYCGIRGLACFLSMICRSRVTDPTSGFQMMNRSMLYLFAHSYPTDYPEPEALALLCRHGFRFREVATVFRERMAGISSIKSWGTLYYVFKVFLALCVDRARPVDTRLSKANIRGNA